MDYLVCQFEYLKFTILTVTNITFYCDSHTLLLGMCNGTITLKTKKKKRAVAN